MNTASDRRMARVQIGPLWNEEDGDWLQFYPEGLPREWRLNYVAHYWPMLLLPMTAWMSWMAPGRDWSEAPEDVLLFLSMPLGLGPDAIADSRLGEKLGERFGGILLAEGANPDLPVNQQDRLYASETSGPASLPELPGGQLMTFGSAASRILVVHALPDLAPRAARMLLEALIRDYDDGREILIFVEGGPRQIGQITEIGHLLGLGTLKTRLSCVAS